MHILKNAGVPAVNVALIHSVAAGYMRCGRNRSHLTPPRVDSAITASAGDRCHVSRCSGSSIGQPMRITANENNSAPAPTKSPDTQPLIDAPRLISNQSASHGNVPNFTVSMAQRQPFLAKSLSGSLVAIGWAVINMIVPTSTSTVAIVASFADNVRPGMADFNANSA